MGFSLTGTKIMQQEESKNPPPAFTAEPASANEKLQEFEKQLLMKAGKSAPSSTK